MIATQGESRKILLTGASGFIGFHLAKRLKDIGYQILCIDSMESSYENSITQSRYKALKGLGIFVHKINLADRKFSNNSSEFFAKNGFTDLHAVIHLAAWPGVLRSTVEPEKYFENNIVGFFHVLQIAKSLAVDKFIFASSSSVYGDIGSEGACSESDALPQSLNFYAQTKKTNEELARTYLGETINYLGLRFFTVIGPWGRPDMAYWKFTDAIKKGLPIRLRGDVGGIRDYTSVYDVIESIELLLDQKIVKSTFLNISSSTPMPTIDLVNILSDELKMKANIVIDPPQEAEATKTFGENNLLRQITGKVDFISLDEMARDFVNWHNQHERHD